MISIVNNNTVYTYIFCITLYTTRNDSATCKYMYEKKIKTLGPFLQISELILYRVKI